LRIAYQMDSRKKKMISRFQLSMITHDACVIIHKEILSLKHCSSIQSSMNQQPEENFVLLLCAIAI
jgi:hypothetical protein